MIRRLVRIIVGLVIIVIVLGVAAVLLKDTIFKEIVQRRIRDATGMDARIGQMEVGILSPTVTIEDLKLYNPPSFGGSLCLDMPELHMEYDPAQARTGKLKLSLVRLNLREVDIVQDKKGRVNFDFTKEAAAAAGGIGKTNGPGVQFAGIDTLNLNVGVIRWSDMRTGRKSEYRLGITNAVFRNINSSADMALRLALASASTNSNFNWLNLTGALLGQ